MKTIEIKLYKFDELSEEIKENALNNWRQNNEGDYQIYFSEIIDSVKKMADVFELKFDREYTDLRFSHIDDDILNLSGVRLLKYIYNNFYSEIFTPKIYSLWSKKEKSFKYYKDGYPVLKRRYSKIFKTNDCVLTGVCYDMDILQPVYDFLEKPDKDTTFEDLIKDIESAITKTFNDCETWVNSDEYIIEAIQANDYEFTKDGKMY